MMRRKLGALGALLGLVAVSILGFGSSPATGNGSPATGDDGRDGTRTLVLAAEPGPTQVLAGIEIEPSDETLDTGVGNQLVSVTFLSGRAGGESHRVCTVTLVADTRTHQCVATLDLPRGQITVQGLRFIGDDGFTEVLAITGGTKRYEGIAGTLTVEDLDRDMKEDRYTLRYRFPG